MSIIIKEKQKHLPPVVQRIMDSDMNCCFNCTYFKLYEGVKTFNLEDYKNLKAKCSNREAIKEKGFRGRPATLDIFMRDKVKFPESRINCNFFKLA